MTHGKLDKLLAQRSAIDARIRQEEARAHARKRKADTRRKILAGAAVLDEAEGDPEFHEMLFALLGRFLTRAEDRALFDLPIAESAPAKMPPGEGPEAAPDG